MAGAELRRRLQALGLWRESGHEHLNGSLVVPITDDAGRVVQMYGRKINDNLRAGTPKHLYLPGSLAGVWNREGVAGAQEIIVCESLIDAMTFWSAGYRNVTAAYGVEGFTATHFDLVRASAGRVLIAYDADAAGDRAAEALATKLLAAGIECYRVRFPRGMDANEYAVKVTPATKSLGTLVRGAEWMGKGAAPAAPPSAVAAVVAIDDACEPLPFAASAEPPLASPVAPEPALDIPTRIDGDAIEISLGDRTYRVRGLERNTGTAQMKITLRVARGEALHVDTLDLVVSRARREYAREAAAELGVAEDTVRHDLGRVWLRLEQLVGERDREAVKAAAVVPAMTDVEREEALELLRDPRLLERILGDFARCGVVGEETNKLVGHLAAVSRKLDRPLGVLIQSSSAAGKSSLMDAILAFVPEEERVKYSAMTGQSLFYMSETELRHKVLALVEEEGAERASYALKLLQSEGELAIASTGKDAQSGRLVTHEYRVEGPVALLLTTTAIDVDEELLNRCIVLTVDEEREQTRAIHREQRERYTLDGMWAREERTALRRVHRNAQRLLRPLGVVNPWARRMTFLDDRTRTRRDHEKYLTLIATIALVHQYQREVKTDTKGTREKQYIEARLSDIETANRLAGEVLGRSLDELAPQTRRMLDLVERAVSEACGRQGVARDAYRFTRREVREATGWSYDQVRVHLDRLVELEYVLPHRGGRGQQFVYELLYDGAGRDGRPFLIGLIDVEALRSAGTTETLGGETVEFGEALGAALGPFGGGLGSSQIGQIANPGRAIGDNDGDGLENAYRDDAPSSYPNRGRSRGPAAGAGL
ncbi:MAG: toprim domain-containing protein [Acidobacteria bacterium]|nr:toprim domain-containing protein [Acidobacteriota bacterium]